MTPQEFTSWASGRGLPNKLIKQLIRFAASQEEMKAAIDAEEPAPPIDTLAGIVHVTDKDPYGISPAASGFIIVGNCSEWRPDRGRCGRRTRVGLVHRARVHVVRAGSERLDSRGRLATDAANDEELGESQAPLRPTTFTRTIVRGGATYAIRLAPTHGAEKPGWS